MKKKILIVSEYLIAHKNGAPYERIKCYAKALPELDFIVISPDLNFKKALHYVSDLEQSNLFIIEGINKNNNFIYRNTFKYFDFIRAYNLCRFINSKYQNSQVKILLYSSLFPLYFWVILYLKIKKGFNVIVEKNEMEVGILKNVQIPLNIIASIFILLFPFRFLCAFLADFLTGNADTVIAISTRIRDKYNNSTNCSLVPLLVNNNRFETKLLKSEDKCIRFIHLGSITKSKDGISELIIAVKQLKAKHSNFHLDIIGDGNRHYIKNANKFIKKNNLTDYLTIQKSIKSQDVPIVFRHYDYGLLIRDRNTQTQYGFSTKLGEYLASGLPVIFTDVSDNLLYLEDSIHGFLVHFPLRSNLANVLEKAILTEYKKRIEMNESARLLAKEKFDYSNYSNELNKIFI